MDFRYRLAKKTFKGKKIPQKRATGMEQISHDQRGDDASPEISPLILDRETITPKPQAPEEKKEVSRRDLFSFGRFLDFAESVEEKPAAEKEEGLEEKLEEELEESEKVTEEVEAADPPEEEPPPAEKKGFFKRLVARFRPGPKPEEAEEPAAAPVELENEEALDNAPIPVVPKKNRLEQLLDRYDDGEEADLEYDRRSLIKQGVHFFAKPAVASVQKKIDKVNEAVDKITKRVPLVRPPGAITERQFLQDCTRCDKCIHACPKDAILKAPKKFGFLIMGTPYIDPKKNPCVMCDDLPCISACPDGALLPVDSPADVRMGYVILDKKKCQAYGDNPTFCQQCVIDCPIPGAITQNNDNEPVFHKSACTGCGVCVLSCSTVNIPVALKIKPQMVIEQQLRKKQMEEEQTRYEAEKKIQEQKALAEELRAQAQEAGVAPEQAED